MKPLDPTAIAARVLVLFAAGVANVAAATRSENFDGAVGTPNAFQSASGMYFSSANNGFVFSTGFNAFYSPYIAGKFPVAGCTGCTARTLRVSWPLGQRALVFGWGTQGYSAVRVTAFRGNQQVWQSDQAGIAGNGLYKQQFNRSTANVAEFFDRVDITWPGGGQSGVGYASLVDNFTSTDAYQALMLDGSEQAALVNTQYALPLAVVVRNFQNVPVANVSVRYQVADPTVGAPSVTFAATNNSFDVAVTDANGIAVASPMTANGVVGALSVEVTTAPTVGTASFALHNVTTLAIFVDGFE
jgi:hypothetical protein